MDKRRSHWEDQQEQASGILEDVLDEAAVDIETIANQSAVEHELQKQSLIAPEDSGRFRSRVLYITEDLSVLEEQSDARTLLIALAPAFAELHIVVTASLRDSKKIQSRIAPNVWLYTTGHVEWWKLPGALKRLASEQLVFGEGFRPDLIVVTNPFEAAWGALRIARAYDRILQVHVRIPFWESAFRAEAKANRWRVHIARFVLKRALSIVAGTEELQTYLQSQYQEAVVSVLPRYRNIRGLLAIADAPTDGPQLFTQYTLRLLYIGPLNAESTLFRAIDAARLALQSKNVALIVVGEGSQKAEFSNRAKILGIDTQVIFKPATTDLLPYFRSADVLLVTDTTEQSDELVIQAAAAGVPMVMAKTQLRSELFEDSTDAFVCEPNDTVEFTQKLNKLISDATLRTQFQERSAFMAKNRLQESPENYQAALVALMESAYAAYSTEQPS